MSHSCPFNVILHGKAESLASRLPDESVSLIVTSPPYALQRVGQYGGIAEDDYPRWFTSLMEAFRPKLKPDASLVVNIRPHVRKGKISDYVLRTLLRMREAGWFHIDDLVWWAPDKPPFGRADRLRRAYEPLHWFARSPNPFIDPRACSLGSPNYKTGRLRSKTDIIYGSRCFRWRSNKLKPRCTDVIRVPVGTIPGGVDHPAMFPSGIPDFLIKTLTPPG